MSYTRIINVIDEERILFQRRQELYELTHYPSGERIVNAAAKVFMAILVGGSTLAAFVIFTPPITLLAAIFFVFGAFVYSIKALRDAYKKRREEQDLITDINSIRNQLRALFTEEYLITIINLVNFSKFNQLNNDETESLYTYLFELKEALAIVDPDPQVKSRYIPILNDSIECVGKKVRQIRQLPGNSTCTPDMKHSVISFESSPADKDEHPMLRFAKKAGNRLLSFMAGASSGAGIGVTIAALAFGISNPVGWALMAIVAGALLTGLVSVAIDYYLSRREDNAIKRLHQCKHDVISMHNGVRVLQQTMRGLCNQTKCAVDNKILKEENAELRHKLNARDEEFQSRVSVIQPACVFGSGTEKSHSGLSAAHDHVSDDRVKYRSQ